MSRTAVLNKTQIIQSAFEIAREKGRSAVTLRELGKRLGKSTAAIYTQYPSIDAIILDLISYINKLVYVSCMEKRTKDKFLNSGIGFLAFVMKNKMIFGDFLLSADEQKNNSKQNTSFYVNLMKQSPITSVLDDDRVLNILENMQIYTYGLATMICSDINPDNDLNFYINKLEQAGKSLIGYHMYSSGKYELALKRLVDKFDVDKKEYI
ncbi:MAG: TetR/AcrR family transcriptional regulator [Acholeplasmataceae bacterium]